MTFVPRQYAVFASSRPVVLTSRISWGNGNVNGVSFSFAPAAARSSLVVSLSVQANTSPATNFRNSAREISSDFAREARSNSLRARMKSSSVARARPAASRVHRTRTELEVTANWAATTEARANKTMRTKPAMNLSRGDMLRCGSIILRRFVAAQADRLRDVVELLVRHGIERRDAPPRRPLAADPRCLPRSFGPRRGARTEGAAAVPSRGWRGADGVRGAPDRGLRARERRLGHAHARRDRLRRAPRPPR